MMSLLFSARWQVRAVVMALVAFWASPSSLEAQQPARAQISVGTGFFVAADGAILTSSHVLNNCASTMVGQPGQPMQVAQIVGRDPINDLALLRSSLKPRSEPALRTSVRLGEAIAVYGFPLLNVLPTSGNFTTGNITATAGLLDDSRMLQISAPIQPGNSGGPVVDTYGNVVGIVRAQLKPGMAQNVNFAVRASVGITFLERYSVSTTTAAPKTGEALSPADLAERVQQIAVVVMCNRNEDQSRESASPVAGSPLRVPSNSQKAKPSPPGQQIKAGTSKEELCYHNGVGQAHTVVPCNSPLASMRRAN
jgi:hypothetical protein